MLRYQYKNERKIRCISTTFYFCLEHDCRPFVKTMVKGPLKIYRPVLVFNKYAYSVFFFTSNFCTLWADSYAIIG